MGKLAPSHRIAVRVVQGGWLCRRCADGDIARKHDENVGIVGTSVGVTGELTVAGYIASEHSAACVAQMEVLLVAITGINLIVVNDTGVR